MHLEFFEDYRLVRVDASRDADAFNFWDYYSLVCGHDHNLDALAQTLRDPAFELSELPSQCEHWHGADKRLLRAAVECALLGLTPTPRAKPIWPTCRHGLRASRTRRLVARSTKPNATHHHNDSRSRFHL
jgi:hypothetical protein